MISYFLTIQFGTLFLASWTPPGYLQGDPRWYLAEPLVLLRPGGHDADLGLAVPVHLPRRLREHAPQLVPAIKWFQVLVLFMFSEQKSFEIGFLN